jgi:energy-coupling factor transport system ATP-binding protein
MNDVVISLRDVSFTYRGAAAPALRAVSLQVRRGELVVVMGATGAGKSTLAKCLNASIPQFQPGELSGSVRVCGDSVAERTVSDLAGTVGLVSQDFEAQLFATNVRQEVAFGMEQLGVPRAEMVRRLEQVLQVVGLSGFERRDPTSLSGGEKQRLAIAAVLALQPRVLVFDEPTTDLDPAGKDAIFTVLAALRDQGMTIVLIEHETAAAERADRLVLMRAGRIVADAAPERVLADISALEDAGVRPLDLDRIAAALRWPTRPPSMEAAVAAFAGRSPRPLPDTVDPAGPTVLAVEAVHFTYPTGQRALDDVSLSIGAGEFVALVGQNGSGKTTLAKCLNGLLQPSAGSVSLRGTPLRGLPLQRIAAEVGYVFQNPDQQLFAASVYQETAFALRNFGIAPDAIAQRVERALQAVGLADAPDVDPFLLGKGQRQRLAVASILALEPSVLILDEPTTGLDYPEQLRMMALLASLHRGGMTVIVITHSPWIVAEYAERAVVMDQGRAIFDGSLRALFADDALLTRCHFRPPDVTRLGHRLGFTPLTVDEFLAAMQGGAGRLPTPVS